MKAFTYSQYAVKRSLLKQLQRQLGKYEQEYERSDTFQQQLKLKISEEEGRLKKDEEEKKRKFEHEEQWVPSRRRRATKGYQKKVKFIPKSEALVLPIAVVFSSIYPCMLRRHFTCERSNMQVENRCDNLVVLVMHFHKAPNEQAIPLLMPQQHVVIPHYMSWNRRWTSKPMLKTIKKTSKRQDSFYSRSSYQDVPLLMPQEGDALDTSIGDSKLNGLERSFVDDLADTGKGRSGCLC